MLDAFHEQKANFIHRQKQKQTRQQGPVMLLWASETTFGLATRASSTRGSKWDLLPTSSGFGSHVFGTRETNSITRVLFPKFQTLGRIFQPEVTCAIGYFFIILIWKWKICSYPRGVGRDSFHVKLLQNIAATVCEGGVFPIAHRLWNPRDISLPFETYAE